MPHGSLDRGIVIDAWIGVSVASIRLVEVVTRIVVASLPTYLWLSSELERAPAGSRAAAGSRPDEERRPPDTARSAPRRRRRGRPRPKSKPWNGGFHCPQGCTFDRAEVPAAESPRVPCPYQPSGECALRVLV